MTTSSQGDRPLELPAGRSAGRLLGLLTAILYGLFTLLPNSNSLIVSWPWVFVWQIMLLLAVLWALWPIGQTQRFTPLGLGFDWIALLCALVVIVSSLSSAHPQQARWYAWVFLAFLAALYGIRTWLQSQPKPMAAIQSLLAVQGYLGAVFIGVSLVVWLTDTVLPFREKAAQLRAAGVDIKFTFAENDLRNWAPLGHQNFVAGYLILLLPLFLLLAWQQRGKQRGFWLFAFGVGLIDFYTTSSRGGLLGLVVLIIFALVGVALQRNLPRIWGVGLSTGAIAILGILIWSNDRLQQTVGELFQGQHSSLLVYRSLNAAVGWQMGKQQVITGIGLGNVPLQYQQFRPIWAGRESELAYQLHSTPVQLFAELGVGGVMVASILWVGLVWQGVVQIRRTPSPDVRRWQWGLLGALLAYGVVGITDYQLDNVAISGVIMIYLACLLQLWQLDEQPPRPHPAARPCFLAGLTLLFIMGLWLWPWLRAWQLSEISFRALTAEKIPAFTRFLNQAGRIAPWEPYYPLQLGWNLGELSLTTSEPAQRKTLSQEAIIAFQRANAISPDQEFGFNNLGWLQLAENPQQASQSFTKALRLVPAKRGLFYGLGLSLLAQQQPTLAIDAFSLECLRDPLFLTNPIWRTPRFAPLYPAIAARVQSRLQTLNTSAEPGSDWQRQLHQVQGGLHWWLGQFPEAETELTPYGTAASQALLTLSIDPNRFPQTIDQFSPATQLILEAWRSPEKRSTLINQAWMMAEQTPMPEPILQQTINSLESAPNFYRWLTESAPVLQYRRQRLGFGVNRRHIDGPNPQDYYVVIENLPMVTWFNMMFPSPVFAPAWDEALQPLREKLWQEVDALGAIGE